MLNLSDNKNRPDVSDVEKQTPYSIIDQLFSCYISRIM